MGITGNIDAKGGQVLFKAPKSITWVGLAPTLCFPRSRSKSVWEAKDSVWAGISVSSNPKCVWDAILERKTISK